MYSECPTTVYALYPCVSRKSPSVLVARIQIEGDKMPLTFTFVRWIYWSYPLFSIAETVPSNFVPSGYSDDFMMFPITLPAPRKTPNLWILHHYHSIHDQIWEQDHRILNRNRNRHHINQYDQFHRHTVVYSKFLPFYDSHESPLFLIIHDNLVFACNTEIVVQRLATTFTTASCNLTVKAHQNPDLVSISSTIFVHPMFRSSRPSDFAQSRNLFSSSTEIVNDIRTQPPHFRHTLGCRHRNKSLSRHNGAVPHPILLFCTSHKNEFVILPSEPHLYMPFLVSGPGCNKGTT